MDSETVKNEGLFLTSSTRLATALLSLGHTLRRPPCTRQVRRDGKTIVTFLFQPSTEGAVDTCGKLAARWLELQEQDPGSECEEDLEDRLKWLRQIVANNDPVAVAYANGAWRDLALMIVKATPRMVEIYGRDSMGFVREDATPQDLKNIQSQL
jgi:hypothetical protein